jgi:putative OPT family oligopeptide transporter
MTEQPLPPPGYREWTWTAILTSLIVGSLMCVAFVYSGLKLGFTLAGSTIAAILGFAVLRLLGGGRGSILEVNQVQTGASAVNVASSGIVFTIPAIFLLGMSGEFNLWSAMLAGIAGTIIGLTVIVPLRKQIIEFERLRFPSGLAVASILRAPGESRAKARLLLIGFAISGILVLLTQVKLFGTEAEPAALLPEIFDLGKELGIPSYVKLAFGLSLLNVAAGLLAGKGGLPMVAGAVLAWWIVSPLAHQFGWTVQMHDLEPAQEAEFLYGSMLRPLGIGVLIGGALMGIVLAGPAIKAAISSLANSRKLGGASDEAGLGQLGIGLVVGLLLLFAATMMGTKLMFGDALITTIVGAVWLALAGLIVAQATGMTDISPISGMALIAVTLMIFLVGGDTDESLKAAVIPAIFVGAAVCVGASQCADMMQDFKTGHLIGARPRLQQLTQAMLTWIGPVIAVGVVILLWGPEGGGFGPGTQLEAPQGQALQSMVAGVVSGEAPWDKYGLGALLGASLSMLPIAGVGVLVGLAMYLPAYITLSYGIGCVISMWLQKRKGNEFISDKLVPFAAGLILGEALIAVGLNIVAVITGSGGGH